MVLVKNNELEQLLRYLRAPKLNAAKGLSESHNDNLPNTVTNLENMEITYGAVVARNGSLMLSPLNSQIRYYALSSIVIGGAELLIGVSYKFRNVIVFSEYFPGIMMPVMKSSFDRSRVVAFDRGSKFFMYTVGNEFFIVNDFGDAYTIKIDGTFKIAAWPNFPEMPHRAYYPEDEISRDADHYLVYMDVYDATNKLPPEVYVYKDTTSNGIADRLKGEVRVAHVNERGIVSKLSKPLNIKEYDSYLFSLTPLDTVAHELKSTCYSVDHADLNLSQHSYSVHKFQRYVAADAVEDTLRDDEHYINTVFAGTVSNTGPGFIYSFYNAPYEDDCLFGISTKLVTGRRRTLPVKRVDKTIHAVMMEYPYEQGNAIAPYDTVAKRRDAYYIFTSPEYDSTGSETPMEDLESAAADYRDSNKRSDTVFIKVLITGTINVDGLTSGDGIDDTCIDHFDEPIEAFVALQDIYYPTRGAWMHKGLFSLAYTGVDDYPVEAVFANPPSTQPGWRLGIVAEGLRTLPDMGELSVPGTPTFYREAAGSAIEYTFAGNAIAIDIPLDEDGRFIPVFPVAMDHMSGISMGHKWYDTWEITGSNETFDLVGSKIFSDYSKAYLEDSKITTVSDIIVDSPYTESRFIVWHDNYIISKNQQAMTSGYEILYAVPESHAMLKQLSYSGPSSFRNVSQLPEDAQLQLRNIVVTKPVYQKLRRIPYTYDSFEELISSAVALAVNPAGTIGVVQSNRLWIGSAYTLKLNAQHEFNGTLKDVSAYQSGFIVFSNTGVFGIDGQGKPISIVNTLPSSITSSVIKSVASDDGSTVYAITTNGQVIRITRKQISPNVVVDVLDDISSFVNTLRFNLDTVLETYGNTLLLGDRNILYRYNGESWDAKWEFDDRMIIGNIAVLTGGRVVLGFIGENDSSTNIDISSGEDVGM